MIRPIQAQTLTGDSKVNNQLGVSRNGNVVTTTAADGTKADVKLNTPEQAELFALFVEARLDPKDHKFALDIAFKQPTGPRMYWVKELIRKASPQPITVSAAPTQTQQVAPPVASVPVLTVDLTQVLEMFHNARQHLKRPKITLQLKSGKNIRFSLNEQAGRLYMNSSAGIGYGYGWILVKTGEVVLRQLGYQYKAEVMEVLAEFCPNPKATAIRHGKLTGNCCFCQLPLSDPRSLNAGYGDTCAKHWHLPWGAKTTFTPVGDWVLNGPKS